MQLYQHIHSEYVLSIFYTLNHYINGPLYIIRRRCAIYIYIYSFLVVAVCVQEQLAVRVRVKCVWLCVCVSIIIYICELEPGLWASSCFILCLSVHSFTFPPNDEDEDENDDDTEESHVLFKYKQGMSIKTFERKKNERSEEISRIQRKWEIVTIWIGWGGLPKERKKKKLANTHTNIQEKDTHHPMKWWNKNVRISKVVS